MTRGEKNKKCDEWFINLDLSDKVFIYEDFNDVKMEIKGY